MEQVDVPEEKNQGKIDDVDTADWRGTNIVFIKHFETFQFLINLSLLLGELNMNVEEDEELDYDIKVEVEQGDN